MPGWAKLALVTVSLAVLFRPGIQYHWERTKNPYFVPYDAVQYVPPFFKFDPNDPIPTTYVKEYYLNALCPLLYKWLSRMGAQLGDVRHFQLGMMYLAYIAFVGISGRVGWVLGGAALSFAVMAFTLTAPVFFVLGFLGGSPRMYAYPLISLVLYSLIRDRPYLLAVTVVLGGLLYPLTAIIGGLSVVCWMLLRPLSCQGVVAGWRPPRRLVTVGLTGFLSIAAVAPLLLGAEPYGPRVDEADVAMYPEVGPEGGYRPFDRLPYKLFGGEWIYYYIGPMFGHGDPIVSWFNVQRMLDFKNVTFLLAGMGVVVLVVILGGIRTVLKEDQGGVGIRLISFFVICGALHVMAWLAAPYLYIPTRYLMYALPFLITLMFPWSLYVLVGRVPRLQSSAKLRDVAFLAIVCFYLMVFGGTGNAKLLEFSVEKSSRPLFDAIAALPNDVVIAGWPLGHMQKVEYVTRRNVFVTADLHQLLHLAFVKAMHERMDALFEAYLSTDAAPLHRLRQEFGVTHLLVETRHFTEPVNALGYYAPWNDRIPPRLAEIKGKEYLMNGSLYQKAAVFDQNGLILLDLSKLP